MYEAVVDDIDELVVAVLDHDRVQPLHLSVMLTDDARAAITYENVHAARWIVPPEPRPAPIFYTDKSVRCPFADCQKEHTVKSDGQRLVDAEVWAVFPCYPGCARYFLYNVSDRQSTETREYLAAD